MFHPRRLINKIRTFEETEVEEIDSCTKLLDIEVAHQRKRRKSMYSFLPSGFSTKDPISKVWDKMASSKINNNKDWTHKRSDKYYFKPQSVPPEDEFYMTWKKIQGSRIDIS